LKLVFHHNFSAAPCSSDDFCLSPFKFTSNDFVCLASELELSKIQAL